MTSYCDVANPTYHLQPQIDGNKVGDHAYRMYGDIASSSKTSIDDNFLIPSQIPSLKRPEAHSALLQFEREEMTAMKARKSS